MFSNVRDRLESESGAIATVYILAAALFFSTAIAAGFGLGKYVQGIQMLDRCTSMTAKATMGYMQRQDADEKGVLTPSARTEGTAIFQRGLCNSDYINSPLMPGTGNINFNPVDSETLVVTIEQRIKPYAFMGFLPVRIVRQAAAYNYQYGDTGTSNPLYSAAPTPAPSPT